MEKNNKNLPNHLILIIFLFLNKKELIYFQTVNKLIYQYIVPAAFLELY